MSSQGIWSSLPMTRWNMLAGVAFHQVRLQYWWGAWGVFSTASAPSGSSSCRPVPITWYHAVPGRRPGPTGSCAGEPGEVEWIREGRSSASACSTFSICHESGAAHYRRVLSTELTWKDGRLHACVGADFRECTDAINVPYPVQTSSCALPQFVLVSVFARTCMCSFSGSILIPVHFCSTVVRHQADTSLQRKGQCFPS